VVDRGIVIAVHTPCSSRRGRSVRAASRVRRKVEPERSRPTYVRGRRIWPSGSRSHRHAAWWVRSRLEVSAAASPLGCCLHDKLSAASSAASSCGKPLLLLPFFACVRRELLLGLGAGCSCGKPLLLPFFASASSSTSLLMSFFTMREER
jgi:hypothetical protein